MKITLSRLLPGVLALASTASGDSTKSLILCTTLVGRVSKSPVPSETFALTVTSRATVSTTFTPVSTLTPPASTTTISDTTTFTSSSTAIQVTDTFSTTTTTTTTDTTTTTIPDTTTVTDTTSSTFTGTTTIPTSPGFTPASQKTTTLPARRVMPRGIEARGAQSYRTKIVAGKDGHPIATPALYPTNVICGGIIEIITTTTKSFTASTTATVTGTPPPVSSTTTTISTTTTTTVIPLDASTTTTFTSTASTTTVVSVTTTQTVTTTTTSVINAPQATYYAACGPDNQLVGVNGQNIIGFGTNNAVSQLTANSAYACCVTCLTSTTPCGAAVLFSNGNICFNIAATNNVCNPTVPVLDYFTQAGAPAADFVSTGNCGSVGLSPS